MLDRPSKLWKKHIFNCQVLLYISLNISQTLPWEYIHAKQREESVQGWKYLFGDVVGGVQSQWRIAQKLVWLSYKLYQWEPRAAVNNHIGYAFSGPGLSSPVLP